MPSTRPEPRAPGGSPRSKPGSTTCWPQSGEGKAQPESRFPRLQKRYDAGHRRLGEPARAGLQQHGRGGARSRPRATQLPASGQWWLRESTPPHGDSSKTAHLLDFPRTNQASLWQRSLHAAYLSAPGARNPVRGKAGPRNPANEFHICLSGNASCCVWIPGKPELGTAEDGKHRPSGFLQPPEGARGQGGRWCF